MEGLLIINGKFSLYQGLYNSEIVFQLQWRDQVISVFAGCTNKKKCGQKVRIRTILRHSQNLIAFDVEKI